MNTVIVGCGAIGSVAALGLDRAGWPVTLADTDPSHLVAIEANGLAIDEPDGRHVVHARVGTPEALRGQFDLLVLAVKSQHTVAALESAIHLLSPSGTVLSLQNGLNPLAIEERLGRGRTVAAFVNFQAVYAEPGVVRTGRTGSIYVGELDGASTQRLASIVAALGKVRPTVPTTNILGYLWSKMAYASMLVSSALVDAPVFDYIDRHPRLIQAAVGEVAEAALKSGVALESFDFVDPIAMLHGTYDFAAMSTDWRAREIPYTGIWRDIVIRKRPTEVGAQLGEVIKCGHGAGLDMPINSAIVRMVTEVEAGQRELGWPNLQELDEIAAQAAGERSSGR